jgi:alkaline phosphatase
MLRRLAVVLIAATAGSAASQAQTIYPLDRAEILSGARFDFKVEFPGAPPQNQVKVTINGQDPAVVFGKPASFVQREDGQDYAAYVIRGVTLKGAADYTVEASAPGGTSRVGWKVFAANGPRAARNVVLFIGDGLSIAHRTAARILSKGIVEGHYGAELAIDDMPNMALVSTSGTDSIVTDSANAMSAYTTGHKSCVNALGVYCARNKNTLDHPKVETIGEIARRHGMAVGVVTNTEIEDATPAGMVAHTRRRADYNDIVRMFWEVKPEVIMGGGSPNWLAKSTQGSKRTDETDYTTLFEQAGWKFVSTDTDMKAAAEGGATKMLGLFNTGNIDGALDRFFLKRGTVTRFQDQPDLTGQVRAALDILQKAPQGFVLMVESGRIDKYSHSLDAERAIYDTIMLDNAVKVAKDWAAARGNDTMIVVVADHAHPVSVVGTYDDARGETPREKLATYADAKTPNYPPANAQGYPETVDVSRRIAFIHGTYPDYCLIAKPYLDGENVPAVAGAKPNTYVANEKYCDRPGAVRVTGNLPVDASTGVHSADDVVLTATGPGSEQFHGRMDNTRVFRAMATALSLGD